MAYSVGPDESGGSFVDRINWSTLKHLAVSPLALRWAIEHPREDTDALRLGRAIHCLVLEGPEVFRARWVAATTCAATTTRGTPCRSQGSLYLDGAWFCRVRGHAPPEAIDPLVEEGLEVLTEDALSVANACAESLHGHPVAAELLRGGAREQRLEWRDPLTGLACRGTVDLLHDRAYLLDLKTTRHATPDQFARDAERRRYYGQVAWYLDGAIAAGRLEAGAAVYIAAVQTRGPYDCAVWHVGREALDVGREVYQDLLIRYADCQAADWWPGAAPDLLEFPVPWLADGLAARDEEGLF